MDNEGGKDGLWLTIRRFLGRFGDDIFLIVCIILIALAAFGLGRLSMHGGGEQGIHIMYPEASEQQNVEGSVLGVKERNFVASISGSKYHLPHCSGAQRIAEKNKIWFGTKEEAEIAGYNPAANCPGL